MYEPNSEIKPSSLVTLIFEIPNSSFLENSEKCDIKNFLDPHIRDCRFENLFN